MTTIADRVVEQLVAAGVRDLFGVPGGGGNLDLVEAARRAGLPFVLTATETGGALAAIAQAEVTGRPGACLTTLGPGVSSVVNGVACARLERAPVVVFTDAYGSATLLGSTYDTWAHQRLDHHALLAPAAKWSTTLSAEGAEAAIAEAIARAMEEPRCPVHIDCPGGVLAEERRVHRTRPTTEPLLATDAAGTRSDAGRALLDPALGAARNPLVIVGLGARDAAATAMIRELCAAHRIPAMVTYKAKGVVPDDDPHFAGVFTNGFLERSIVEQADLIVAVGLDEVELLPRPWTYPQAVARVPATDVAALAAQLSDSSWDLDAVQRSVSRQREAVSVSADGLAPHRVVQIVARAAGAARVTVDAGAHMFPATLLWPVAEPNGLLISNGLSTMGFALPAAIGAALLPRGPAEAGRYHKQVDKQVHDEHVVALTGDGGLLMCAGELSTVARERLPIVIIVFNDASLSLIDVKQRQRKLEESGVSIGSVNWRGVAESFGIPAYAARTERELEDAISCALEQSGPTLIDVHVDPGGYGAMLRAVRG
jgi:acetolactate synthase-1/2/3 large subunit